MMVAFLDLLGFSNLLEVDAEVAADNLYTFNNMIRTRVIDELRHPITEYEKKYSDDKDSQKFVKNHYVTSFENMISFSDSLVIGSKDVDLFIDQLMNFVSTVYITSSEPFRVPFDNIRKVENHRIATGQGNGEIRYHKAFPVLFRGGLSFGENVSFYDEYHIRDSHLKQTSNVFGQTYLKAVKLEKFGKGPRLFCDDSVVNAISKKRMIKEVDRNEGVYEIVWTIEGCETTERSSIKWNNVIKGIDDTMLPAAVNLYNYYKKEEKLEPQYKGLLDSVCCGIIKYANDECQKADDAIKCINEYLVSHGIDIKIKKDIIENFLA